MHGEVKELGYLTHVTTVVKQVMTVCILVLSSYCKQVHSCGLISTIFLSFWGFYTDAKQDWSSYKFVFFSVKMSEMYRIEKNTCVR